MKAHYPLSVERDILAMLKNGPLLQKHISAAFPHALYLDVRCAMQDMARRGIIVRQKRPPTYLVRLPETAKE